MNFGLQPGSLSVLVSCSFVYSHALDRAVDQNEAQYTARFPLNVTVSGRCVTVSGRCIPVCISYKAWSKISLIEQ